jgi:ABC-2 type transport system permease protein
MDASAADLGRPVGISHRRTRSPAFALARRAFLDSRIRTISFAYLFAAVAYIQPVGYRHAYPNVSQRISFAHSFGDNKAIRLFYGTPHDLLTVGGYTAWRVGGTLAIFAAVLGLLAAVRALRTEEDAGRTELVLAGAVRRRTSYLASLSAIAAGIVILWLAELAGSVLGGLPVGPSAYLALASASVVAVFVGVGAVASQLAPSRRLALELGGALAGVSFVLRVVADTAGSLGWLRWLTPLGWAEEMRPFTGARPWVLMLAIAATALLLLLAGAIAARRDVGSGLLPARDSAEARLALLSSPTAYAVRAQSIGLTVWVCGVGVFAFILGVVSKSITSADVSRSLDRQIAKLGAGSILTSKGYLGFTFIFFVFAVSLFACAQIGSARHEEAGQQLETQLALPVSRRSWLAGRLLLATAAAAAISLCAGFFSWAGAASQGVHISLPRLLEAGFNCLPAGILFLGIAALAYALAPRASAGIAYGLAIVAFLWQLFGSLLGAPRWLIDLTPFRHVGLVPAQAFRPGAALVMVAIGALAAAAAIVAFERRDLMGA